MFFKYGKCADMRAVYDDAGFVAKVGADSFVYKSSGFSVLRQVVIDTYGGKNVFPESKKVEFINENVEFTFKEIEVLKLLCKAYTRKEIVEELSISENTAKYHIDNIKGKTGFESSAKLAIYA